MSGGRLPGVRLMWPGRGAIAPRPVAPLRPVEGDSNAPNLLIRGDNRVVMTALAGEPWAARLEALGGVAMVYMDPPFFSGRDFFVREHGEDGALAYSDRWPGGLAEFLATLEEQLALAWALLREGGTMMIHLDQRVAPHARLLADELFTGGHLVNEIIWHYHSGGGSRRGFGRKHDVILFYAKGEDYPFHADAARVPYEAKIAAKRKALFHPEGKVAPDVWTISRPPNHAAEWTGYPTQKPLAVLERLIAVASNPGDLVLDPFGGSGTTAVVAARLGRRFLHLDAGAESMRVAGERLRLDGVPFGLWDSAC